MVTRALIVLLLMLWSLASAQAAELTAEVDRKEVALHEHVVLTISLINSDTRLRAQGVSPNIDLSVLTRDFDIGTPHVENNYNIFRGRGRSTSKLSVDLFPRRAGRFTIPTFSVDGLSTKPITVEARGLPPGAIPEIFSRAGVSKDTVWQRQQFVAWLDVYHRVQLKTASIGEYISTEPLAIELMEHRDLPQSERKETVKGVDYDVTRIAWAIFPKQSGALTVYLPDVWIVTADGRKLRLPHQQRQVKVKTLPAEVTADIAVGKPHVTQTAPVPAPSVNNISTWTVTLRGPFSRFALPDILPMPPLPPGIKIYGDHAQRDSETLTSGLTSVLSYTLSALPQNGGTFDLPPLRIPYFDTARGTLAVTELPGASFTVPGGAADTAASLSRAVPADATQRSATSGSDNALMWQLATLLFAVLWLVSTILLWRRSRASLPRATNDAPAVREPPPPAIHHPLQAQLLAAFSSRTLEQGLSAWERNYGRDEQLRATVRAVQQLCYGKGEDTNGATLSRAVEDAVAKIRAQAVSGSPAGNDPWRPESFATHPSQR